MSIDNILTEHKSGRRISRPKINWLINEVYTQRKVVTDILLKVNEFEDTEEIMEEIELIRERSL